MPQNSVGARAKGDGVSFSGGFWSRIGKKDGVKKFFQSQKFLNFLEKCDSNFPMMEVVVGFCFASLLRPFAILAVPGAKKEDKRYTATKAFLSGCVDLAFAYATVTPVKKKMEAFAEKLKDPKVVEQLGNKVEMLKNKGNFKTFKKVVEYIPKYIMLPARAALTVALVPPTLKILFPEEAKKLNQKKAPQKQAGGVK